MGKRWLVVGFILMFLVFGLKPQRSCMAKDSGNADDIGKYQEGEGQYSYPGIIAYVDGVREQYALDTWKKEQGEWTYCSTRINDQILQENYSCNPSLGIVMDKDKAFRSVLFTDSVKRVSKNYSVLMKKIQKGEVVQQEVEYSDDTSSWDGFAESSFCKAKNGEKCIRFDTYGPEKPSYKYYIYNARQIAPSCNGYVFDMNGGTLTSSGLAYYNGKEYIVRQLPVVEKSRTGYQVEFLGWYDSKNGGRKIEIGDSVEYGQTFYAHWVEKPMNYQVHYIDLLKDTKTGETELITHTYAMAPYDSYICGADKGSSTEDGAYYKGYTYQSATKEKVTEKDTTVYRYFIKSSYDVCYIDKVISGKKKDTILAKHSGKKEYQEIADGKDLGADQTEHIYHEGYWLKDTSSATVCGNGTVVYRYFEPVRYSICFDGNGNTAGSMRTLTECEYLSEIALSKNLFQKKIKLMLNLNCEQANCDSSEYSSTAFFCGWSLEKDGTSEFVDEAVVSKLGMHQDEAVTLYAIWDYSQQKVDSVPSRLGYRFAGWSQNPDDVKGNTTFQFTSDTQLYAIWKPDIVKYNVEYYKEKEDGTFEKTAQYQFEGYTQQEVSIEENEDIYTGYYLDRDASVLSGKVKADGSLVLSAYYLRKSYQLSFDSNQGNSSQNLKEVQIKNTYGQSYCIPDYTATRHGYRFIGWSTDKENYQRIYQSGETFFMPNHDVVLYAAWEPICYQVQFEENLPAECATQEQKKMELQKIPYDQATHLAACSYQAKGYAFDGWCKQADGLSKIYHTDEEVVNLTTQEGGKVILYAIWKPLCLRICYHPGEISQKGEVAGDTENTMYQYDKDCFAANNHFILPGYHVTEWNTKKDGSGISVKPGENLKGKYIGEDTVTLYAIWEANENTAFTIEMREGIPEEYVVLEKKILSGQTNQSVKKAIEDYFKGSLQGEDAIYFYSGYVVKNKEELQKKILADGSLELILYLEHRKCNVQIYEKENGRDVLVETVDYPYETDIKLPKVLESVTDIARYMDGSGNVYQTNEKITLKKNLKLFIQHLVAFEGEKTKKEYVMRGESFMLPEVEKTGYALEGWYEDNQWIHFAGKAGQRSVPVYNNLILYPKWSNPLTYKITFDIQASHAVILEGQINHYEYGKEVILPDASQVAVPDGYLFVGWYDAEDKTQTIQTKLEAGASGDKVFHLLITKKPLSQNEKQPFMTYDEKDPAMQDNATDVLNENSNSSKNTSEQQNAQKGNKIIISKNQISYLVDETKKELCVCKISSKKKRVVIPQNITWKKEKYRVTRIGKKAVYRLNKLQELIIGDDVEEIDSKAIIECKLLSKVRFGKNLIKIGDGVFNKCKKISTLSFMGKKVKKIGKNICCNGKKKIIICGKKNRKKVHLTLFQKSNRKVKWTYRVL